jgi:uncharacterized membrane protein
MNKKHTALVLIIICTFLTAFGQIAWKVGASKLTLDFWSLVQNYALWIGFVLYGLGAIFLIFALKNGNLSFVHPLLSLGYVWAGLMAFFYLRESFPMLKLVSIAIIIAGTFLIFRGDVK